MNEKIRNKAEKWFNRLERWGCLKILSDRLFLKIKYRLKFNKKLNLKNPKTFSEKLQWIKLNDRKAIYSKMVDKFESKTIVSEKIGAEYVVPCLGGPWYSFDEIDFDRLPDKFVLKTNHDSGGVVICKDKKTFDFKKAEETLKKHLKNNYYWSGREWPYKSVKPCIFAEEYLDDNSGDAIYDFKFFCFNGVPKIMYLSRDKSQTPRTDFFDMEYNRLNMRMRDPNSEVAPEKPERFDEMRKIATLLSANIPHIRVDFYMVGEKLYVGEMTFFHCGGFVSIKPDSWDSIMGEWIKLPTNHI